MAAKPNSGLRTLKPNEILFNDGDKANSLYIIQSGQLRLFKPKGKGFVEIAVLRAGEVIGEMAYFDQDGGGKRSCSASALVSTSIIEISFTAFSKTMSSLNPWFKTIINTLANRLRQTNSRVKALESNSTSVNYGTGKHSGYTFFKTNEIIKILGTLFLVYRSHGEQHAHGVAIHRRTLSLYSHEIFGIVESKLEEMIQILRDLNMLVVGNDNDGAPNVFILKNVDQVRNIFIFYNSEKHKPDEKKIIISKKSQIFLEQILGKCTRIPEGEALGLIPVSDLLENWKSRNIHITIETLADARLHGIVADAFTDEGSVSIEVNFMRLKKLLPNIQFMNRIEEVNQEKA